MMTATKIFFSTLIFAAALAAVPAHAIITISSDEVWDGISNPRAGEGVLLNGGVYSIPDSIVIGAGVTVYLQDPFSANISDSITWEFLAGAGGLTFTDANSTIDVYTGDRNGPQKIFTINMNNNSIGAAATGAGRIINGIYVVDTLTGDPMSVSINSLADVTFGTIDVTRNDALGASININTQGLIDIDSLANGDVSGGGGSALSVNITGETLVLGDFDTRSFRADGNGQNGDINLRALGQPENDVGDFNANSAAVNSITLDGFVNTNAPSPINANGNLNLTAVEVTLASTFMTDLSEGADMNVTVGTTGNGFVEADLLINNSSVSPDTLNFTVFHDGVGPGTVEWNRNNSGSWSDSNNWNPVAVPQSNNQTAVFGSILTSGQTIFMDQAVLVKGIRFDTPQVALAGTSGLTLEADSGNASLEVLQGSHDINVQVTLNDTTDASASAGAELDLNGVLNLNGNTLNVSGAGQVNINTVATGLGTVVNSGVLGTDGLTGISGGLTSTGTLDFDISGTTLGLFDAFGVTGTATLSGQIDVALTGGFVPTQGDAFTVISASSVSAAGLSLTGPAASSFNLIINADSIVLQANGAGGLPGDFDGDNDVDGADFLLWQLDPGVGNLADWQNNFGMSIAAVGAVSAVPEPASWLLIVLGTCGLFSVGRSLRA